MDVNHIQMRSSTRNNIVIRDYLCNDPYAICEPSADLLSFSVIGPEFNEEKVQTNSHSSP